jgi:hypothetical protein
VSCLVEMQIVCAVQRADSGLNLPAEHYVL